MDATVARGRTQPATLLYSRPTAIGRPYGTGSRNTDGQQFHELGFPAPNVLRPMRHYGGVPSEPEQECGR